MEFDFVEGCPRKTNQTRKIEIFVKTHQCGLVSIPCPLIPINVRLGEAF
jgi:hypothetical protein